MKKLKEALGEDGLHTLLWALSAFAGFIIITELVICAPLLISGTSVGPMPAAEVISLLSGAVTAAALAAVYLQVRDARRNAAQQIIEVAVRADQLHAEFNSTDMRKHRDRAYTHLKLLDNDRAALAALAEAWIYDRPYATANNEWSRVAEAAGATKTAEAYRAMDETLWSISCMVAFYVRVEAYLRTNDAHFKQRQESTSTLLGPFYWQYWANAGIRRLVEASDEAYRKDPKQAIEEPYYVTPLRRLDDRCKPHRVAVPTAGAPVDEAP
jgi:hypothetical protein